MYCEKDAWQEKISFMKDEISKQFGGKVIQLVHVGIPNLWGIFKNWFYEHVVTCVKRRVVVEGN